MKLFDGHIHAGVHTKTSEIISFLDRIGGDYGLVLAADHGKWDLDNPQAYCSDEAVIRLVNEGGGRLYGLSSVSPYSEGGAGQKAERAFAKGLKGLKIYPHGGFFPNDRRLYDAYELAQSKGYPVFIHTGMKAQRTQRMIYNNPVYIDDIAVDFPHLKIVIMHAGYPWIEETLVLSHLNENVMVDLTFLDVLSYTYGRDLLSEVTKRFCKVLGSEKVIWGSEGEYLGLDAFRDDGIVRVQNCLAEIRGFNFISEKDKENILYQNAFNLLEKSTGKPVGRGSNECIQY